MRKPDPKFPDALAWHRSGKKLAGNARSVHLTGAVLSELDEAIRLLRLCAERTADWTDVHEFLVKHNSYPNNPR